MYKLILLPIFFFIFSGCGINDGDDDSDTPSLSSEPYYKYQWSHYDGSEFPGAVDGAGSYISAAQEITRGSGVTVAIIDSCFDTTHEDAPNHVIATYDTETGTSDVSCREGDDPHGISMSGILGAPLNGKGLVGVAPDAKFILIRLHLNRAVPAEEIINAFTFAKNHGAQIISNSWAGQNEFDFERDIFADLKQNGITILFACGNDSQNLDSSEWSTECEDPSVIGVGSTNKKRELASYTNYGSNMDVLAPGGENGIVTIDGQGEAGYNPRYRTYFDPYGFFADNFDYTLINGTSAATPVAAGVAALVLSANPSLTPDQIRYTLVSTGDDIAGWPKVNAFNAVSSVR